MAELVSGLPWLRWDDKLETTPYVPQRTGGRLRHGNAQNREHRECGKQGISRAMAEGESEMCASLCAAMREKNGPARQEGGPPSLRPELLQGSSRAGPEPPARAGPCGRPGRATLTRPDPVGGEVTRGGGTRCLTTGQGQLESSTVLVLTCQVSSMWMSSHNDVQLPGCAYSLLQCTPLTYLNPFWTRPPKPHLWAGIGFTPLTLYEPKFVKGEGYTNRCQLWYMAGSNMHVREEHGVALTTQIQNTCESIFEILTCDLDT